MAIDLIERNGQFFHREIVYESPSAVKVLALRISQGVFLGVAFAGLISCLFLIEASITILIDVAVLAGAGVPIHFSSMIGAMGKVFACIFAAGSVVGFAGGIVTATIDILDVWHIFGHDIAHHDNLPEFVPDCLRITPTPREVLNPVPPQPMAAL